ncbi:hypothetical protein Sp245p_24600 (plasmid) [Azospirillum baldaniorum]|uniref:Uncharacterized protein n=1 Tax=Azospirillum baldaniorum TaxID=1064539 RepID=A0A9P1JYS7_9PROT|nr:hypothetical protein Sp245p_24600 [Azospirillum baldaniorum]CCD02404.1 protein of unknown function [Azospirillum baldaniorum]
MSRPPSPLSKGNNQNAGRAMVFRGFHLTEPCPARRAPVPNACMRMFIRAQTLFNFGRLRELNKQIG